MISACTREVGEHEVVDPRLDVLPSPRPARHRSRRSRSGTGRARSPSPPGSRSRRAPRGTPCAPCGSRCARARSTCGARCRPRECAPTPAVTSPLSTLRGVHDQPGDRRLHVAHLDARAVVELDHALVGELPAALGVERRAVEDQLDLVALASASRHDLAVATMPRTAPSRDDLAVAGELDRRDRGRRPPGGRRRGVDVAALLGAGVRLGALALLGPSGRGSRPRRPRAPAPRPSRGSGRSGSRRCRAARTRARRRAAVSPPDCFTSAAAWSKIVVPARSVCRNASSSA